MTKILALIGGSAYAQSVCDFAAWAATRTSAEVALLHVLWRRETASAPPDLSGSLDADERDELPKELAGLDEPEAKLALPASRWGHEAGIFARPWSSARGRSKSIMTETQENGLFNAG